MKTKKLCILTLLSVFYLSVFSQVTSFNFDPNKVNVELANIMDSLYQEDQKYRIEVVKLIKEGASKELIDSITLIIKEKDSSNLVFATQLIDKYGWLSPQDVGFQGAQALFLIIQHSDLKIQKKY